MSAYDDAERIFLDKYGISSSSSNKKNGPLVVGKIKGKCVTLSRTAPNEVVNIPRYASKYDYLFVVFKKYEKKNSEHDDVFVYNTASIQKITGRSFGTITMRSLPLSLDVDSDLRKVI